MAANNPSLSELRDWMHRICWNANEIPSRGVPVFFVCEPLIPSILRYAQTLDADGTAYDLAHKMILAFDDIHRALNARWQKEFSQYDDLHERMGTYLFWSHKSNIGLDDYERERGLPIDKRFLEEKVAIYLENSWMQNSYIDWCIVDALIRFEWAAFYGASGFLSDIPRKYRGTLLAYMQRSYRELDGNVLNPSRVERELMRAADAGVGWSTVVWPVLGTVITRNPSVWHVVWPGSRG